MQNVISLYSKMMFSPWNNFFIYNLDQDFLMKKSIDFIKENSDKCFEHCSKLWNYDTNSFSKNYAEDFSTLLKKYAVNNMEQMRQVLNINSEFCEEYVKLMQKSSTK